MSSEGQSLTRGLEMLLSVACGICVASLYYIQPLEAVVAGEFGIPAGAAGIAVTFVQLGYAAGLLLVVPLGDLVDRGRLVFIAMLVSVVALFAVAISPSFSLLVVMLCVLGFGSVTPQLIIPLATHLAPQGREGATVGTMMSGLLAGILLSRTFGGVVGELTCWRSVYLLAAVAIFALALAVRRKLPSPPSCPEFLAASYQKTLASLPVLVREYPELREAAVNGFLMFGAFSCFWGTVALHLAEPGIGLGAREAGLLGLTGLVGVLMASPIGRIGDRCGTSLPVGIGSAASLLAYLVFLASRGSVPGLVVGAVVLDLGKQFGQVSNMARVQALGDGIRSRTDTIFMFSYFLGGSAGSAFGAMAFGAFGWSGTCVLGGSMALLALLVHVLHSKVARRGR